MEYDALFSHPVVNEAAPSQNASAPVQNPEFSDAVDRKTK